MTHAWMIPQREYDRQLARRGRLHAFESLAPARTALVVVDMVPFFTAENAYCRGVMPAINALAAALRGAGGAIGPLPDRLAEREIDTVVVAGTVTNVCVESTARDARTLGYRVILAADGCATVNDAMHNATLTTVYRSFGDVRPTAEILDLIAGRPSNAS